jgi:hypothetical protein
MTDFELVYLLNEVFNTLFSTIMDYTTGLFAMLVASYLVASKLSRGMAGLIVALFSLFAFAMVPATIAAAARLAGVLAQASRVAAEPGSAIAFVFTNPFIVPFIAPTIAVLTVLSYIGGVVFFVQARRGHAIGR